MGINIIRKNKKYEVCMMYNFTVEESETIIKRWGENFYNKLPDIIAHCKKKWGLHSLSMINYFAVNCIFKCKSQLFGDAVLKIGTGYPPLLAEMNVLREYNGKRFCKLYDFDSENNVILEECVTPGDTLWNGTTREDRIDIFTSVYSDLHIAPMDSEIYPTYLDWILRCEKYTEGNDYTEIHKHALKAKELYQSIIPKFSSKMLLHGDLHHNNILLREDKTYAIIDPKGVIGDPVFDIAMFVFIEFNTLGAGIVFSEELYSNVEDFILHLSEKVSISEKIIKQCFYIQTVVHLGDGLENYPNPDYIKQLLSNISHAEKLLP
jgi:streptomycin 6-kinase